MSQCFFSLLAIRVFLALFIILYSKPVVGVGATPMSGSAPRQYTWDSNTYAQKIKERFANFSSYQGFWAMNTINDKIEDNVELLVAEFSPSEKKVRYCEENNILSFTAVMICGIHAREITSTEVCVSWMEKITHWARAFEQASSAAESSMRDPCIRWVILPLTNPRGRDSVVRGLLRHKLQKSYGTHGSANGTDAGLCLRLNKPASEGGVDLNRNWPTLKDIHEEKQFVLAHEPLNHDMQNEEDEEKNVESSIYQRHLLASHKLLDRKPSPEEAHGGTPLSEPETRIIDRILRESHPDMLFSVHTGDFAILVPFDGSFVIPHNYEDLLRLANWMHTSLGPFSTEERDLKSVIIDTGAKGLYATHGAIGDYAYLQLGVPFVFSFEVYRPPLPPESERYMGRFTPSMDYSMRDSLSNPDLDYSQARPNEGANDAHAQPSSKRTDPNLDANSITPIKCFAWFNPLTIKALERITSSWCSALQPFLRLSTKNQILIRDWLAKEKKKRNEWQESIRNWKTT